MPWRTQKILTDVDGNFIPQVWDPSQNKFIPYEAKVSLSGTIATLSTDPAPEGSEGMTWLQHNPTTGETKVFKYISGDWREL